MSKPEPDITSRAGPLMLMFAKQRGLDVRALVEKWKLPIDLLVDSSKVMKRELTTSAATLRGLSNDVAEQLSDPGFAVALAAAVPKGSYGVAEFLIRSSPTHRSASENLVRFSGLLGRHQTFTFVETENEAQLHNSPTVAPTCLGRYLNEYATKVIVDSLKSMADVPLTRVWFINPPPASIDHLVAAFGTKKLAFDQPTNGHAMARSELEREVKGSDSALFGFLEEHAIAALASRPKGDDLIDRLRELIREAVERGEPSIERLAMRLQLSARTLQRRLAEKGTSFQEVLDGARFDLARAFLREARLELTEIAYLLGYSELRAFDRAFKRWSGLTPGEYRVRPAS